MSRARVCYYIYYRVAPQFTADARRAVGGIMRAVEEKMGIAGRLLRREDDALLWMEVYESVVDTAKFEAALGASLERAGFELLLAAGSRRRTERFVAALD